MDSEEALLRAIRDNPGDDGPKLVYADWLEEQGDLRGEFIRLACELNHIRRRLNVIPGRLAELGQHLDSQWLLDVFGRFRVVLYGYAPDRKIATIRAIRQVTGYGLKESKDLSESLPSVIVDGVSWDEAARVRTVFADAATVFPEPSTRIDPYPPAAAVIVPNFRIILRSHLTGAKLQTIKALRSMTGLTTAAAREVVESLPRIICERMTLDDVERYRAAFRPFAEIDAVPMSPLY